MPVVKDPVKDPTRTPEYNPDEVREPKTWCPAQRRRAGFEGI